MLYTVIVSYPASHISKVRDRGFSTMDQATRTCIKRKRKTLTGTLGLITTLGARVEPCLVGVLGPPMPIGGPMRPTLCCEGTNG